MELPATGGTYAIALRVGAESQIRVGALGLWRFPSGVYLYVGSAWGPGGLRARVRRHLAGSGTQRWHIDYLRQHAAPLGAWLAPNARVECMWASWLADPTNLGLGPTTLIVPRFGASDCTCPAHLCYLGDRREDPPQVDFPFPHDILFVSGSLAQSGRAGAF
jgi:Uri superfamily endonuclease